MQGAQKLRSEAHVSVRRNDEKDVAQRRRWTFCETITCHSRVAPGRRHFPKTQKGEEGFERSSGKKEKESDDSDKSELVQGLLYLFGNLSEEGF